MLDHSAELPGLEIPRKFVSPTRIKTSINCGHMIPFGLALKLDVRRKSHSKKIYVYINLLILLIQRDHKVKIEEEIKRNAPNKNLKDLKINF